jgi:hypothetical protein
MNITPTLATQSGMPQSVQPQSVEPQSVQPQAAIPRPVVVPQARSAVQADPAARQEPTAAPPVAAPPVAAPPVAAPAAGQQAAGQEATAPSAAAKSPEPARGASPDAGPLARYQRRVDLLLADSLSTEAGGPPRKPEHGTPATQSVAAPVWLKPEPATSSSATRSAEHGGPAAVASASSHSASRYAADWAARLVRLAGKSSS